MKIRKINDKIIESTQHGQIWKLEIKKKKKLIKIFFHHFFNSFNIQNNNNDNFVISY